MTHIGTVIPGENTKPCRIDASDPRMIANNHIIAAPPPNGVNPGKYTSSALSSSSSSSFRARLMIGSPKTNANCIIVAKISVAKHTNIFCHVLYPSKTPVVVFVLSTLDAVVALLFLVFDDVFFFQLLLPMMKNYFSITTKVKNPQHYPHF